jgi:shikimate kinase
VTGRGRAQGAVSIVNATATGLGCSLAIAARASATWSPAESGLKVEGAPDARLVEAVIAETFDLTGARGATVTVDCPFPPSRGLKTSSSVAAALVRAAADSQGQRLEEDDVVQRSVAACLRAGVTITGAYDDQVAVVRGGCRLTDNTARRVVATPDVPAWAVAVWVPESAIPKDAARTVDVAALAPDVSRAVALVRRGDVAEAMTVNGRAFHRAYAAAGLPVDARPAELALEAGALGAGLSGTGPAVAALFDHPVELPPVPGGTWQWSRAVPS